MIDKNLLSDLKKSFHEKLDNAKTLLHLDEIRVSFLGKKGSLTEHLQKLSQLSMEERKKIGAMVHEMKESFTGLLNETMGKIQKEEEDRKLKSETIDVTLPGRAPSRGAIHPLTKTLERIISIFSSLGFKTVFGPEIETEYYNFDALNIPSNHPARTTADTFFVNTQEQLILRTQTSGMQIRTMEKTSPPLAIISPGLCFRKDEIDPTHLPLFHQVEGLVIDKNLTFADLKGVLALFAKEFFGSQTSVRFRPDFFPFTEPSAEVAFSCPVCGGKNDHCSVCHGTGSIEVAGCGLVHPNVLKNGGIDPHEYSGYAFGFGVERLAMIYYGVPDIRYFYENHPEFLRQFKNPLF